MRVQNLHQLAGALGDGGIPAIFEPASLEVPIDAVLVELPTSGPLRPAQLLLIPGLTSPRILQIFHLIEAPVADPVALLRYLGLLNALVPLPGFGYNEVAGTLFYRHCLVVDDDFLDVDRVGVTLNQAAILLAQFAEPVGQVARGDVAFEEARADLMARVERARG